MKTLAILSRKGGTGKTTLATHLSVAAESAGETTALVDIDPQANAAKWGDVREGETPAVFATPASRLAEMLSLLEKEGATLSIIDTAGAFEEKRPTQDAASLAASLSALVVIPCKPAIFDLQAISSTINIIRQANVSARIVFNAVPPRSRLLDQAKRALEVYEVPYAPCTIGQRVAFSYAAVDGLTVQEFEPNSKAASEIRTLYQYIAKEMEVVTCQG